MEIKKSWSGLFDIDVVKWIKRHVQCVNNLLKCYAMRYVMQADIYKPCLYAVQSTKLNTWYLLSSFNFFTIITASSYCFDSAPYRFLI